MATITIIVLNYAIAHLIIITILVIISQYEYECTIYVSLNEYTKLTCAINVVIVTNAIDVLPDTITHVINAADVAYAIDVANVVNATNVTYVTIIILA